MLIHYFNGGHISPKKCNQKVMKERHCFMKRNRIAKTCLITLGPPQDPPNPLSIFMHRFHKNDLLSFTILKSLFLNNLIYRYKLSHHFSTEKSKIRLLLCASPPVSRADISLWYQDIEAVGLFAKYYPLLLSWSHHILPIPQAYILHNFLTLLRVGFLVWLGLLFQRSVFYLVV